MQVNLFTICQSTLVGSSPPSAVKLEMVNFISPLIILPVPFAIAALLIKIKFVWKGDFTGWEIFLLCHIMCNQKYKYKKHEKKLRRAINYLLTRVIDGGHSWEKPSERPGKSNPFNSILYFVYFTYFSTHLPIAAKSLYP